MWYNTPGYAPVAKLVYAMDFGDVTSVRGFCCVLTRDLCTAVDKHLEGGYKVQTENYGWNVRLL